MEQLDVVIIGAGAVGLAIAAEIAQKDREIYILEKETNYSIPRLRSIRKQQRNMVSNMATPSSSKQARAR